MVNFTGGHLIGALRNQISKLSCVHQIHETFVSLQLKHFDQNPNNFKLGANVPPSLANITWSSVAHLCQREVKIV